MDKKINNNGYDYVDLELPSHALWSIMNVGASKPSDSGLYFQWGDTQGYTKLQAEKDKKFNWDDYKWYESGNILEDNIVLKKYTTEGATLDLEDDAAHVHMGGDWHMPTPEQYQELIDNTTSTWTKQDGVNGRLFTSKKDGTKSIFIPAAGYAWNGSVQDSGDYGDVWSSMLDTDYVGSGQGLSFDSGYVNLFSYYRCSGLSVRGVIDQSNDNSKENKNNMDKNEKLNLVEILKNVPKGTKLWSPVCGDCYFQKIVEESCYPIVCTSRLASGGYDTICFTIEGIYFNKFAGGGCALFPYKENQDWSTFVVPKKHKEFKPFQKVLIPGIIDNVWYWFATLYSHYNSKHKLHVLINNGTIIEDDEIIPYEGNEDKLGTRFNK